MREMYTYRENYFIYPIHLIVSGLISKFERLEGYSTTESIELIVCQVGSKLCGKIPMAKIHHDDYSKFKNQVTNFIRTNIKDESDSEIWTNVHGYLDTIFIKNQESLSKRRVA